jgi:D-alanyl-lipoteichoic acid acyltransferase DltB (MBOAT superfamily)
LWFNSLDFGIFFAVVLGLYWAFQRWRAYGRIAQNVMLLAASYFFYGYWDARFLILIFISTLVDYVAGLKIFEAGRDEAPGALRRKRLWLTTSMCTNLGLLGFFKYFNFFVGSFEQAFGLDAAALHLDIVLPVGISFYTFQTMSYTIDIYRGRMKPTRRFIDFALFVAFFPQLVAGPIERATMLLPQMLNRRRFDRRQFGAGVHLIFFGLFKKVFVADNLAVFVNRIFNDTPDPSGFAILAAVWAFAFQIYCDFSGYSDIARGCAKCLGFELRLNFNHPYVARNPRDFWARWHMSLSTWLRDYLYISLGGNRRGRARTYRNLALTMLLGGLWHGAAWHFVLWGAYHGAVLIVHRLFEPVFKGWARPMGRVLAAGWTGVRILVMFHVVCFGWLLFRANDLGQVVLMVQKLWAGPWEFDASLLVPLLGFAGPLVAAEAVLAALARAGGAVRVPAWARCVGYAVLAYLLVYYGAAAQEFVYFQF